MKQSRRQELRTNELSIKLQELYEKANRYSTHILVVVLALLVIVLVTNYLRSRQAATLQQASEELSDVRGLDVTSEEDNALERARQLVEAYGDTDRVGPQARDLLGRMVYQKAMLMNPRTEKETYVKLLKEAEETYQGLIAAYATDPMAVAEARMMLAKINESLAVVGERDSERVRELYASLADNEAGIYKSLAEEALASLDERLKPLRLVEPGSPETQPARTPIAPDEPETAPAVETGPADDIAPAAEAVDEPVSGDGTSEAEGTPPADTAPSAATAPAAAAP
jgi:hypothetical protein